MTSSVCSGSFRLNSKSLTLNFQTKSLEYRAISNKIEEEEEATSEDMRQMFTNSIEKEIPSNSGGLTLAEKLITFTDTGLGSEEKMSSPTTLRQQEEEEKECETNNLEQFDSEQNKMKFTICKRSLTPSTKGSEQLGDFFKKRAVLSGRTRNSKSPVKSSIPGIKKISANSWHEFLQQQKKVNREDSSSSKKIQKNYLEKEPSYSAL